MRSWALIPPLLLVLAACSQGGTADVAAGSLPEPDCVWVTEDNTVDEFVGLDADAAEKLAAEMGLEVRVLGADGECFIVTDDYRTNRVNLEYADGVVVGAAIY